MGDVLVAFIVVLAIAFCIVGSAMFLTQSSAKRKRLNNAPAILVPPGSDPDVLVANATRSYATAQAAVRLLEKIGDNPLVSASIQTQLGSRTLKEMRALVNHFYNH